MEKNKMITVSDSFLSIYKNFNVFNQVDKMKALSKRELYLLLTLTLDKFDENDPVVKFNQSSFNQELLEIFDLQDDKEEVNPILLDLGTETDDKYIETDFLVDSKGNKLPNPLTKDEVRDAKINIINND